MGADVMVTKKNIEVVMPTYNGAHFVEEQISSIFNQTIRPSRLLVRDDCSTDKTLEILYSLKEIYHSWLCIMPSNKNIGCSSSIDLLLSRTSAPYIALSDQDDFWLENKLELCFEEIQCVERDYGFDTPILIHTDLKLVDAYLRDLHINYSSRQLLRPSMNLPSQICITNTVTGCTILMNRPLLEKSLPIPSQALVHDWWIALVASVFGKIRYISSSPILYRQHSSNLIGATGFGFGYWYDRIQDWLKNPNSGGHSLDVIRQIDYFYTRYGVQLSILPRLLQLNKFQRLIFLLATPLSSWPQKHGFLRTLSFYFWLFCY